MGLDKILHHFVLEHERPMALNEAHASVAGGHNAGKATTHRFYKHDYGGLPFMHMLWSIIVDVIFANVQGYHHDEMKCHWYHM